MRFCVMLAVLLMGNWSTALAAPEHVPAAAAPPAVGHAEGQPQHEADAEPHPVIAPFAPWAGAVVIGILGMFLAAAAVGVAVRANTPEEVPPAHSHDEPPGASHHHGPGGTLDTGHRHDHG